MARHRFGPNVFWTADISTTPPTPRLAPNLPFTVWTDWQAGANVSALLVDTDLTTPFTPQASSLGELRWFYGPDTQAGVEVTALYLDAGSGVRYPLYSDDALVVLLAGLADGGDATVIAQQALDLAGLLADRMTTLEANAVRSVGRTMRIWPRTAAEGLPAVSEGLAEGDYAAVDVS